MSGCIEYPSVTIDETVYHVGISKDLLDKPCSTDHLTTIASLLTNWQKYAEALRLPDSQIQDIKIDPLLDTGMKAQKVMKMWHRANGFKATYDLIVNVCLQLKDVPLAEKICRMIKGWHNYNHTILQVEKNFEKIISSRNGAAKSNETR